MKISNNLSPIATGLSASLIAIVGLHVFGFYTIPSIDEMMVMPSSSLRASDSHGDTMKIVNEARSIIESQYVDEVVFSGASLGQSFIRGMTESLRDPFSEYLTGKDLDQFSESLRGSFAGIGAVIGENDDGVIIREILPDSPAYVAQLKVGDVITRVGTQSLRGKTTAEAVTLIRGDAGTQVQIEYRRGGIQSDLSLKRAVVKVPSVVSQTMTGGVLYVQVKMFGQNTARDFRSILEEKVTKNTQAVVIDLRDNGGGLLSGAQDMLSHFLPPNTVIMRDKGRSNNASLEEEIRTQVMAPSILKLPIVVIVNENSASASEIFAGAIQDYKRGVIIGRKTYGKGSVQQPFTLSDGSQIKITIARWFTPLNHSIDKIGITPDILIEAIPINANADMIAKMLENEKLRAREEALKLVK